jgi:hypothetical protein
LNPPCPLATLGGGRGEENEENTGRASTRGSSAHETRQVDRTPELAAQAAEDFQFIRTNWVRELKP